MAHTPGPWEWFSNPNGIYLATPHSGHLLVMDAVRSGMQGGCLRFATWKGEDRERMGGLMRKAADIDVTNHHDARLIAAAPELLAALEAFLAMSYPTVGQDMSYQTAQDIQQHRSVARAAIAKAKAEPVTA